MILHALTVLTSAFLLFLLQLITAKQILPWFGGSAAVWITCLVFFQVGLLLGYIYSDWSSRKLTLRQQVIIHGVLLIVSLALLPLIPDASWKPIGPENPGWRILGLLSMTIGLPYFLLSSTNPLIQAWFVRTYPKKNVYRLFALSNLGSLLALPGYLLFIEPWVTTLQQAQYWAVVYGVFVVLCCATAWHSLRKTVETQVIPARQPQSRTTERPPTLGDYCLWAIFAAMGSWLLLAVTNHLSQNIAADPLLWVLPLSVYLLTFILCFEGHGWYRRNLFLGLLAVFLCAMAWTLTDIAAVSNLTSLIGLFSAGLFVACMFCHGELNTLRPGPQYLTRFYLMVALGGALGAIFVGIIAPLIFPGLYEFGIGLCGLAALMLFQVRNSKRAITRTVAAVLLFTLASTIYMMANFAGQTLLATRNFYGSLRVSEIVNADPEQTERTLIHGTIRHGSQYPYGRWRDTPTTYYRSKTGIGRTLLGLQRPDVHVGLVGLGVGVLAAYGRPGDNYRFYEINSELIQIAQREFTYLKDSAAKIEIILGDARLSLERETNQQFDVLVVDAFSGDAIPVHLLTREALGVYLGHMKPQGVIAFHVTNRYVDLAPVLKQLADVYGLKAINIVEGKEAGIFASQWVLLTKDQAFLDLPGIKEVTSPIQVPLGRRVWTDDFNNLLQVLK